MNCVGQVSEKMEVELDGHISTLGTIKVCDQNPIIMPLGGPLGILLFIEVRMHEQSHAVQLPHAQAYYGRCCPIAWYH